ncbi:UNVERIFIED_CONTAM: hypothetical protein ABIC26_000574 [Paenibacillus sp. PvR008]
MSSLKPLFMHVYSVQDAAKQAQGTSEACQQPD